MPSTSSTPNILLITVDQMRYPRFQDFGGMAPDLKDVLGFQPLSPNNSYAQYFPDLSRLRKNAVVLRQRILDTLDQSGLAQNTLVVFLSDHGEYGAAHGGMIEKWHTAYEEILHVPFLVSAPWINTDQDQIRYVDQLTSHIDVLPTLMGLAGIDPAQVSAQIPNQTVEDLPGANLSAVIADPSSPVTPANGEARTGVLFISDDTITELLKGEQAPPGYKVYLGEVESLRRNGLGLSPGPVMQPCHLRCARTTEFKLVRYFDPENKAPDQWELYDLVFDPIEQFNLVTWTATGEPVACPERLPAGSSLTAAGLDEVLRDMRTLLKELEQQYLGYPHPVVEGYVSA